MDDRVILHLIRHEKTAANIARKYIGWTDEPIVTEQVHMNIPVATTVVYGSDLMRCEQTAALYFPSAKFKAHADLRETHFGDFEMKTYEELKDNLSYRAWIDCPGNNPPLNGESLAAFQARVLNAVKDIVVAAGQYTFVVHGGVIRILLAQFAPDVTNFQQVMANHRTLYTLEWSNIKDFQGGARCKLYSEALLTEKDNTSKHN
ncbi:histidine phosphatase family protein [Solibacillus sp. FSL H8-0538]|uniref:histidine phosphatase family protein n=1 Tax=Solibacillus sp. FSL H8-0538 TaxID=2921400 RepID=UPI0030FC08D2